MTTTNPDPTDALAGGIPVSAPVVLSTGTRGTRVLGIATHRVDGVARGVRAGLLARRPRPAARRCASCTSTCRRSGWPTWPSSSPRSARRSYSASGAAVVRIARLGPHRRRQCRGRRAFVAVTLVIGIAVGPPHVGRVLAVGRPPHHHRPAVRHLHRLPRRAPPRRQHQQRAKRSAVIGLLAVLEIPLVHWSVRAVAQPPPGGDGAQHRRRHRDGRADAVQPVRRCRRVHAALRLAGAAPHAGDGDGGPARRPGPRRRVGGPPRRKATQS